MQQTTGLRGKHFTEVRTVATAY